MDPKTITQAVEAIINAFPPEKQLKADMFRKDLEKQSDQQLFRLQYSPDLCAARAIDCRGLTNAEVKPMVDGLREYRKSQTGRADAEKNFLISIGSLAVSFCSLILSALAFRKKARSKSRA